MERISAAPSGPALVILIPVFNDWPALGMLLEKLDGVLAGRGLHASVYVVDDGSTVPRAETFARAPMKTLDEIHVLQLRRNMGHQRAIAIGLAFLESQVHPAAVAIMDADGEDDPRDVPALLERLQERKNSSLVFAERTRRSEGLFFRCSYWFYRVIHLLLTGIRVRMGNFSALPGTALGRLVTMSELWNHYAASVVKSRMRYELIPTSRAKRLDGKSSMGFVSLVVHGLSALSVYGDIIGVRLIAGVTGMIALAGAALLVIVAIKVGTSIAIPGWASTMSGLLLVLLLQGLELLTIFVFIILNGRSQASFLPLRDYSFFVEKCVRIDSRCQGIAHEC